MAVVKYDLSGNCFICFPTYESHNILRNNGYDVMFVKNTKDFLFLGHFRREIGKNCVLANHRARIN